MFLLEKGLTRHCVALEIEVNTHVHVLFSNRTHDDKTKRKEMITKMEFHGLQISSFVNICMQSYRNGNINSGFFIFMFFFSIRLMASHSGTGAGGMSLLLEFVCEFYEMKYPLR